MKSILISCEYYVLQHITPTLLQPDNWYIKLSKECDPCIIACS
ncbi:hypothetical protein HMPREF3190_00303 [Umbribacter vaginalis]|nr:hypothetical protein HMPREF3190_00303 [Coriobacteriales bacterium DNF00809]